MLPILVLASAALASDLFDSSSVLDKSLEVFLAPEGRLTVAELNLQIANTNLTMVARKRAIASLLGWHLPLGSSSEDAARVFTNPQWIRNATIIQCKEVIGWLPIDLSTSNVYQIRPFPSRDHISFDIFIGISGMKDTSPQECVDFLEGKGRGSLAHIVQCVIHSRSKNDSTWIVIKHGETSVTHEGEQHRYQLSRWGPRGAGQLQGGEGARGKSRHSSIQFQEPSGVENGTAAGSK